MIRFLNTDSGNQLLNYRYGQYGLMPPGQTTLDSVHLEMLLFGYGRSESLKQFLVGDGISQNAVFWRVAQTLSALYPTGSEEKRWVDGILARKKDLGFLGLGAVKTR